jgi:hypothetical protein
VKTKILLIDDDIVSVPHVADELRLCGFDVETMVKSSQIAKLLTRQRAFPADFLILDAMIPSAGHYFGFRSAKRSLYRFTFGEGHQSQVAACSHFALVSRTFGASQNSGGLHGKADFKLSLCFKGRTSRRCH